MERNEVCKYCGQKFYVVNLNGFCCSEHEKFYERDIERQKKINKLSSEHAYKELVSKSNSGYFAAMQEKYFNALVVKVLEDNVQAMKLVSNKTFLFNLAEPHRKYIINLLNEKQLFRFLKTLSKGYKYGDLHHAFTALTKRKFVGIKEDKQEIIDAFLLAQKLSSEE